ncbi:hypothetical protein [Variovorax sp. Root434]|uniref:hypothetical protein n=1 Tax=Variovorax sp. Root434 TaxID=1736536 RepID=UPI0012F890DB|nr:hypothetical protein [Variovorax sp. Root434]
MIVRPYPEGIDCVWLASDKDGHLGAFITAGVGPIPAPMLDPLCMLVEEIEGELHKLPTISQARLLLAVPRPDSYIELAERGMFVYDWNDVHRTVRESLHVYEPVAVPTKPATIGSLPSDLMALVKMLNLPGVAFSAEKEVDVHKHFKCVEVGSSGSS